jgi:hypothetical protein
MTTNNDTRCLCDPLRGIKWTRKCPIHGILDKPMGDASTRKDEALAQSSVLTSPANTSEIRDNEDVIITAMCKAAHKSQSPGCGPLETGKIPGGMWNYMEAALHAALPYLRTTEPVFSEVAAIEAMATALNDSKEAENHGFSFNERLAKVCFKALKDGQYVG